MTSIHTLAVSSRAVASASSSRVSTSISLIRVSTRFLEDLQRQSPARPGNNSTGSTGVGQDEKREINTWYVLRQLGSAFHPSTKQCTIGCARKKRASFPWVTTDGRYLGAVDLPTTGALGGHLTVLGLALHICPPHPSSPAHQANSRRPSCNDSEALQ